MYAKGHLIMKGDGKITIETEGDLEFNVGGTLSYHVGGDMITNVRGSVDESIDGSKSFEVAKDMSIMVAGDNRITAAGKMRIQSSKSLEIDAADDITLRTDHNLITASQQKTTISSIQAMTLNSRDAFTALSVAAMDLETQDKFTAKSTSDMEFDSSTIYNVLSQGNLTLNTQANYASKSSGSTKISSQGAASIHSAATTDILAAGLIQIKGTDTDIQLGGSNNPDAPSSPSAPKEAATAELAQYAPANTIIDNITSIRVAPDFPKNANKMSAEEFSLYKNEGGYPNPKAEAYAAGNKGAGAVYNTQDSGITAEAVSNGIYDRPAGIASNNGVAEQNPYPMPTSIYNSNEKLSRHVTIGQIQGLRDVTASNQKQVLQEAMNVAWNILDPLYEKFGGRMYITSWYRDNSPNHIKGGAVDIRCANKPDYGFTAEIAAYVRDNLPFNKVLLEKNDQGGIHCHVEAAQPGQQGGGTVLTCADPHCQSSVPGLQLSYAVAALEGRNYAG
jgi:head-tail adaptor